jgi:ankyrin repeat protein
MTAVVALLALVVPQRGEADAPVPILHPGPPTPDGDLLVEAARGGNLNRVEALLAEGIPVDSADQHADTALYLACENHADVAQYLIGKKAAVNAVNNENSTPLLNASFGNNQAAVLALLDAGADPNIGSKSNRFPLMWAANQGNDEMVKALLAHHADVNANCNEGPAVYWAAAKDHLSTLKILTEAGANLHLQKSGKIDPDSTSFTLLGFAAWAGDSAMVDYLLDQGLAIDEQTADGGTPLMASVEGSRVGLVKKILEMGVAVDTRNSAGQSALTFAARYAEPNVLRLLLNDHANVDFQDKWGRTALIYACLNHKNSVVQCLVDASANLDLTDKRGATALVYAGDAGETELVALLAKAGAQEKTFHILPPEKQATPPLSAAQRWALAVGAIYPQVDTLNPQILGNGTNLFRSRELLSKGWKIHDRVALLREINSLWEHGHHAYYFEDGKRLAGMSDDQFQQELAANPAAAFRLKAARASYLKWGERSGLAWDLCRSAMLVSNGYAAHYLSEKEAWDQLFTIARHVQGNFKSWKEMSENFLDGREIWDGNRDPHFEACSLLLLDPGEANSPWNLNAWETVLPGGDPAAGSG